MKRLAWRWNGWLGLITLCLAWGMVAQGAAAPSLAETRQQAEKIQKDGNYQEAYNLFAQLARNPQDQAELVGDDLRNATSCLEQLDRLQDCDALIEDVVKIHAANWQLLLTASHQYRSLNHGGYMVDGKFERGYHRGGTGKAVNAEERDWVRALQLMQQALKIAEADPAGANKYGNLYYELSMMLLGGDRGFNEAWRLQTLTDLTGPLPDYEDGWYRGGSSRGAPVTADGTPVYYRIPASWDAAMNDGERMRWAVGHAPSGALYKYAQFLQDQFSVETMAEYNWFFRDAGATSDDPTRHDESGTWELHTLQDNETIAKLATGIKRFTLPDDANFIKIFQKIADDNHDSFGSGALEHIAREYENRRQYEKAKAVWAEIAERDAGRKKEAQRAIDQIVKNWGQFEPIMTQPAGGKGATVEFRFRNANQVKLVANEINVAKLLDDLKAYLRKSPKELDWEKMDLANIGWRLVEKNQSQYLLPEAARWEEKLTPRDHHWDRRVSLQTPLKKAGAYLLTATLPDGNTSRIVLWVADSALVQKPLADGKALYFAADAISGKPLAGATLEFFGWSQRWVEDKITSGGKHVVFTATIPGVTDANGLSQPTLEIKDNQENRRDGQWLATMTTPEGRLAFLGFNGVWWGDYHEREYNQTKVFVMTDRPVYRPEQTVKFKIWGNQAQYDREGKSPFAGQESRVIIYNPRNEKLYEKSLLTDSYGGVAGELALPKDATLGVYRVEFRGIGSGTFRVEEYKKPEFEVTVAAPKTPVMLGEAITATIQAKYYFGAPVAEGKVSYKVLRTPHDAAWYPVRYWDWCYGGGYWWFAYDYAWYPGWRNWGMSRPSARLWWTDWYAPSVQPEVIAEGTAALAPDGTFKITFDTAVTKAMHGDSDHQYKISAEVTDASRRVISGSGTVLVARQPFKVYNWVDRGWYRTGDVIQASFNAMTLDQQPIAGGKSALRLFKIRYQDGQPQEEEVDKWNLTLDAQGTAQRQLTAAAPGQYRLSLTVTDTAGHTQEGGYLFSVMGEKCLDASFRFNNLELVADKAEYAPGDQVALRINANQENATVLLFLRPANGVYLPPQLLRLDGKSALVTIPVEKKDMPNFFVEVVTVSDGQLYSETKEIVVPPESRVLNVEVTPSKGKYLPGEKASVKVKLTGPDGKPYQGSTVLSVYDKAVEYISGGSNVPAIKEFFWKWRRTHQPHTWTSLDRGSGNLLKNNEISMDMLGVFGAALADEEGLEQAKDKDHKELSGNSRSWARGGFGDGYADGMMSKSGPMSMAAPSMAMMECAAAPMDNAGDDLSGGGDEANLSQPTVRSNFADTAFWVGTLETDSNGEASVDLTMPESLTTWKTKVWAMGDGCRVGEGTAEVITTKNLIIRLQAPRFLVQKDEVVLSANVHNYLPGKKKVKVRLDLEGDLLVGMKEVMTHEKAEPGEPQPWSMVPTEMPGPYVQEIEIDANGEARVDWVVRVKQPGIAKIRMSALTDEESDAMEISLPLYVHGMLKTESFSVAIRPDADSATMTMNVPAERRPAESRLEVRYSPTLAGAMVDALPYLVDYPYGCTEQTLNRFLPTVVTQRTLLRMGLNLKEIQDKRTNLNAQEIGDDAIRAADWRRNNPPNPGELRNPVFDEAVVLDMVKAGIERLESMQCSDGGWGWFSGYGERSYAHTTAVVVHGLQQAKLNDAALPPAMLDRGVQWLAQYQAEELRRLQLPEKDREFKRYADDLDALVHAVLADAGQESKKMRALLYRDRNRLSVYAKAMFALTCHHAGDLEKRDMLQRNIEQFLVQDPESQTAYLRLPEGSYWWCWYGGDIEAMAWYLKLLAVVEPKGEKAAGIVKYLVNNRKHATYWNNTRDTAYVIEAFADFLKASGEEAPDLTVVVLVDGQELKRVKIDRSNLFSFDNQLLLTGDAVTTGKHTVELRKEGKGALYANAYLINFTLEDPITKAGLELKIERRFYKLEKVEKTIQAENVRGNAIDQKVEKYERRPLANLAELKSGDLAEVELVIESKNDYEYVLLEDMKAAGFEPVEVRSGYNGNDMGAYVEFRDERVVFFVRALARGKHSLSYRLRAEIPGVFSALPAKASAMYAPELKANSDEFKAKIRED